jgi:hypothetical protein
MIDITVISTALGLFYTAVTVMEICPAKYKIHIAM